MESCLFFSDLLAGCYLGSPPAEVPTQTEVHGGGGGGGSTKEN